MPNYIGGYSAPRADLGEALLEYRREGGGNWVTPRVLPTLSVPKKSATFAAFTRASLLATSDVKRSMRGKYNRIQGAAADHTYNTQNYGVETLIDDAEREFFSNDFDADWQGTLITEMRIKRAQEMRTSTLLFNQTAFNTATCFTDHSADAPWTNVSTDVYGQILAEGEKVRRRVGMKPNKLTVARPAWNLMKQNTDLKNRRNVTVVLSDMEMEDSLTELLGLEEIVIADEVYNSAGENGTATVTDIWSPNYALLAFVAADGASLAEPSLGRLITWDFMPELQVTSYREEKLSSDVIRVEHFVQEFLYDYAYGQLIKIQ